jgi:hypothetical protein
MRVAGWLLWASAMSSVAAADGTLEVSGGDATVTIVVPNLDDDDRDGQRDGDDDRINGPADWDDLAVFEVRSDRPFDARLTAPVGRGGVFVAVEEDAAPKPLNEWFPVRVDPEQGMVTIAVEARMPVDSEWDGRMTLEVRVDPDQPVVTRRIQVAPLMVRPATAPATTVLVREFPGRNDRMVSQLREIAAAAGVRLEIVPGDAPYPPHHIWLQDAVEFLAAASPRSSIAIAMPANRNRSIDLVARDRLLGPGVGYHRVGSYRHEFAEGEGGVSWIDWYGNLEASPPTPAYPQGRVLYGVDAQRGAELNPEVIAWLAAQGAQPPLALDVGWLTIKHVDEMLSFVPTREGSFRVLVPDTLRAIESLDRLSEHGHRDVPLLTNFESGTTVGALLDDADFIASNRRLQAETIEPMIATLLEGIGVGAEQLVRIPALFQPSGLSRVPNMVNCLVLGEHVVMADPNGPIVDGVDVFQQAARDALQETGVTLHFVDDQQYHRWSGNVHCATNAIRPLAPAGPEGE